MKCIVAKRLVVSGKIYMVETKRERGERRREYLVCPGSVGLERKKGERVTDVTPFARFEIICYLS